MKDTLKKFLKLPVLRPISKFLYFKLLKYYTTLPPRQRLLVSKKIIRDKFSVIAEWTRFCNLSCPMCDIGSPRMRKAGHMSLELWGKILSDCKRYNMYVDWTHIMGEPLLWQNFKEGMKMWKDSGLVKYGHISTNGILLDKQKAEIIKDTGIEFIRICLDTLDEKLYQRLRNNNNHSKIIQNIKNLIKIAPNIRIQVQLMRTKENWNEDPYEMKKLFDNKVEIFVTQIMRFNYSRGIDQLLYKKTDKPDPCKCTKVLYEHCPITWDGYVGLCCVDSLLLTKLGHLNKDTNLKDIYLSREADQIREEILKGNLKHAPACKDCYMDFLNYSKEVIK